jgi:hypothetical protein
MSWMERDRIDQGIAEIKLSGMDMAEDLERVGARQ